MADARKTTAEKLIAFRNELHEAGVFRPEHIEHLVNKAVESLLDPPDNGMGPSLIVK
ncbi:hypothetical protein [Rhodococcus qingshengii]|uniref:hypothetical protein n=1 Tax=Rhodococcus qingshengii TaxID=334542 RepID=UPI001C8B39D0|nr:hypothetical protein [Rhodococcus qingshengii]MBX9150085.1 hypothetical protein [Rhodococcus qingshengii]